MFLIKFALICHSEVKDIKVYVIENECEGLNYDFSNKGLFLKLK